MNKISLKALLPHCNYILSDYVLIIITMYAFKHLDSCCFAVECVSMWIHLLIFFIYQLKLKTYALLSDASRFCRTLARQKSHIHAWAEKQEFKYLNKIKINILTELREQLKKKYIPVLIVKWVRYAYIGNLWGSLTVLSTHCS